MYVGVSVRLSALRMRATLDMSVPTVNMNFHKYILYHR